MLVAEGAVDVSAEPEVSLWDLAALQVIVEEAGGRFTSLAGEATPDGGSVVCTNGHLHDEVLALLADGGRDALPRATLMITAWRRVPALPARLAPGWFPRLPGRSGTRPGTSPVHRPGCRLGMSPVRRRIESWTSLAGCARIG